MPDFWRSCGYRLLGRDARGRLAVTDDFLRSYLARPELAPVPESCAAELRLHDALLAATRGERCRPQDVGGDRRRRRARELPASGCAFATGCVAADSLEAAYVGLFRGEGVDVPPLFVAQLTQILLRHILGDGADSARRRARPRCCFARRRSR